MPGSDPPPLAAFVRYFLTLGAYCGYVSHGVAGALAVALPPFLIVVAAAATGFLVFGSGLVVVSFVKTYVVDQYAGSTTGPSSTRSRSA